MLFVAYVEVVLVFGRILLGAITFQNSCVCFALSSRRNADLASVPSCLIASASLRLRLLSPTVVPCSSYHPRSPTNSLLAPLFFAHFLRLRYYLSPPTRTAFSWVSAQVDHACNNPKCPPQVKKGVKVVKELVRSLLAPPLRVGLLTRFPRAQIIRYSESIISPQQPGAAAAGAAAGGAEARRAR